MPKRICQHISAFYASNLAKIRRAQHGGLNSADILIVADKRDPNRLHYHLEAKQASSRVLTSQSVFHPPLKARSRNSEQAGGDYYLLCSAMLIFSFFGK